MDYRIIGLQRRLEPLRQKLLNHPLYERIQRVEDVQLFQEHHVYAVWDFMALLKFLQRELTCVNTLWYPSNNRLARRLINEIVLAEESDVDPSGAPASHYELYLNAMRQSGAALKPILLWVEKIQEGYSLRELLRFNVLGLPLHVLEFLRFTESVLRRGKVHEVASAFTFGREDLIPDLFSGIVKTLHQEFPDKLEATVYYLERHIELDGDEHGPMAHRMIHSLCGEEERLWQEVEEVAVNALQARLALWDGMYRCIVNAQKSEEKAAAAV